VDPFFWSDDSKKRAARLRWKLDVDCLERCVGQIFGVVLPRLFEAKSFASGYAITRTIILGRESRSHKPCSFRGMSRVCHFFVLGFEGLFFRPLCFMEVTMKRFNTSRIAGLAVSAAMLVACGGNGSGTTLPGAGFGMQAASNHIGDAAGPNLSGEYSGSVDDTYYGKGTATAFYAAYANAVGGVFTLKFKKATIYLSAVQTVSGPKVDGSTEGGSGSAYCTSSTSAKYDAKTNMVSGSYTTVYGCITGEKGTFSLKHQCYFKGSGSADIRPNAGAIKPC
jgi:hypothetical protein